MNFGPTFRLDSRGASLSDPAALLKLCARLGVYASAPGASCAPRRRIEVAAAAARVHRLREKLGSAESSTFLLDRANTMTRGYGDAVDLFAQYLEFVRRMSNMWTKWRITNEAY